MTVFVAYVKNHPVTIHNTEIMGLNSERADYKNGKFVPGKEIPTKELIEAYKSVYGAESELRNELKKLESLIVADGDYQIGVEVFTPSPFSEICILPVFMKNWKKVPRVSIVPLEDEKIFATLFREWYSTVSETVKKTAEAIAVKYNVQLAGGVDVSG